MKLSKEQFFTLVKELNVMEGKLHKHNREFYDVLIWEMSNEEAKAHQNKLRGLAGEIEGITNRLEEAKEHETYETLKAWSKEFHATHGYRG